MSVVALTSFAHGEGRDRALAAGFAKPIDPQGSLPIRREVAAFRGLRGKEFGPKKRPTQNVQVVFFY